MEDYAAKKIPPPQRGVSFISVGSSYKTAAGFFVAQKSEILLQTQIIY